MTMSYLIQTEKYVDCRGVRITDRSADGLIRSSFLRIGSDTDQKVTDRTDNGSLQSRGSDQSDTLALIRKTIVLFFTFLRNIRNQISIFKAKKLR